MKFDLIANYVVTDSDRDRQKHAETDIEGLSQSFWSIWVYLGLSKLSAPIWPQLVGTFRRSLQRNAKF